MHVLWIGEQDVSPSPLICTAEVQVLAKRNKIEEAYFCNVWSPFLSTSESISFKNDCVVNNVLMESNMAMTTPSLSSKESSSASMLLVILSLSLLLTFNMKCISC